MKMLLQVGVEAFQLRVGHAFSVVISEINVGGGNGEHGDIAINVTARLQHRQLFVSPNRHHTQQTQSGNNYKTQAHFRFHSNLFANSGWQRLIAG